MGDEQEGTKRRLRREISALRRDLDAEAAVSLGRRVCDCVASLPDLRDAAHVAVYAPVGREVDPASLVRAAEARGARVYYPRADGDGLEFVAAAFEALAPGPHGVPEPPAGELLPQDATDVVILVPGVAFDEHGARLGRGLGCYDRALALHPTALRVGLAYDFQIVPRLPEASWDERMDVVATERRLIVAAPRDRRAVKENSRWT